MTNFDKLVRWDADYYKSLTDDDCIVCLTERQVYVLGQIIEQIPWQGTRWTGDISGLDFDLISGNLEYRLAERMTCQNLTTILETVNQLSYMVQNLQTQFADYADPAPDFDVSITVINDVHTPEQLQSFGVSTDNCESADKDAIYGAVSQLVRYINQRNVDFLEKLSQAGGIPENLSRLISAAPVVGLLPFDEAVDYASFLVTELIDEYDSTVDEALLQQVICDIFCIAVASGCTLDFNDVYNYFGSKVSPTFSNVTTTFLDLVQFGINGTFTSDMYFHFMCYFQLLTIGTGQYWLGLNTLNDYAYQTRAGLNSPDNDWSIFCIDCPTFYRVWSWDFANGLGDFTLPDGTLVGGRVQGEDLGTTKVINLNMPIDPTWRFRAARVTAEWVNGAAGGTNETDVVRIRPTPGSNTGALNILSEGFVTNGIHIHCDIFSGSTYVDGGNELNVRLNVSDNATSQVYIDKIEIQFDVAHFKPSSVITTDSDICT